MKKIYKFIGAHVILILLISESRQHNEKTEEDKKIEAIFGPIPEDGQSSTEVTLSPEIINAIFGATLTDTTEQPRVTTLPVGTPQQTGSSGNNNCSAGVCVPYYQCLENGVISTNGEELIDIRFGAVPCSSYLEKCCMLEDQLNKKDQINKVETTTNTPIFKGKHECGHRNTVGIGFRITGDQDNEAHYGEFPWMVAVTEEILPTPDVYVSGGSLIHPSVVLTAAHHFYHKKRNTLRIRAGEWDTMTTKEQFPHQERIVREVIIHENFYEGGLHNDIALLILEEPVELGDVIDTVCLPPQNYSFEGNNNCFASGWGQNSWGNNGNPQVILKKVELPMVPKEQCQEKLRRTRLGRYFQLDQSFVCAGGQVGQDTCKGDGGSPLVCPIHEKFGYYYQSGIVSWGLGCGEGTPSVYVNVARFRNWIDQKFAEKGFETSYHSV